MANRTDIWRWTLSAALLALATLAATPDLSCAQGYGDRSGGGNRNDRPDGGRRRGGGPGGNRGGDRHQRPDRNNGDNNRSTEVRTATPAPAAASSATSFGTVSEGERIRKFATDTLKKHDANSNGILEGDELKDLGTSRNADKDGDGKITHNELVAFYTPKTESSSTSTTTSQTAAKPAADAKSTDESDAKRKIVNTSRKSYRFKTTKERINSWKFSSKDANSDGQVSMSEYSSSWTDRTASEFLRYDKDNDGMITVEEAK